MLSRRGFLGSAGAGLLGTSLVVGGKPTDGRRKRMAIITTEWRYHSHAWHMAERFLVGYPIQGKWHRPPLAVVAAYIDQFPKNDLSRPPDGRMKKILTEAAAVGGGTARANAFHTRDKAAYYYPNSVWQTLFLGGYRFETQPGVLNLDAYAFYYFMAIGVTPAMDEKMVGRGSQYAWACRDAKGQPLPLIPRLLPARVLCIMVTLPEKVLSNHGSSGP